ncbi:hypothetical protein TNCV_4583931 [Trichonephila clavipes]|nr:hypothetical protein TNCV_4583931 [Trichonephila clavipes]
MVNRGYVPFQIVGPWIFPYESAAGIYGETRTHCLPSNVQEIDHYDSRVLMVWTGVTLDGHTHFYVYARGTMTAVRYRDEVLESYVHLFTV